MDYSKLISIDNLFQAWEEFKIGKRKRYDVQLFERYLEDNLFKLHEQLTTKTYQHSSYTEFYVNDPERRHIHKANVLARIVHHLFYKYLYALFDKSFIDDSYSCRLGKGTHKAVERLEKITRKVSKNFTRGCWVLKCDIKKFFASVDHKILAELLQRKVKDTDITWLIQVVIDSFHSELGRFKGVPLGNLTSQIFANIYLSELDQFVKHELGIKYYLRYADDFLILALNKADLYRCIDTLKQFLAKKLKLELHPKKLVVRKLTWGVDFCGYIALPHHILPRTRTKRRILKKLLRSKVQEQALQSYLGYFSHANSYMIMQQLKLKIYLKIYISC